MTYFERIMSHVPETDFDAVLVLSPVNRRYLTGFPSSAGCVAVTPQKTVFYTDSRYFHSAETNKKADKGFFDIEIALQDGMFYDNLSELLKDAKRILVEESFVTLEKQAQLKEKLCNHEFVCGASAALSAMRAVKTENELEFIIKAQQITDKAFDYIVGYIADNLSSSLTEAKIARELDFYMIENGASGVAFDTIAVSGEKSSMPHGVPEELPLSKGFLTMDFGAAFNGYASDMTRTICIGKPSDDMKKVYNTVLNAQLKALEYIEEGKSGKSIDAAARDYIKECGYGDFFGHALGHSLGLEIHENPNFSPSNEKSMPEGCVISVEPGIYIPGKYGVRIEDIVNITKNGCKNLTKSTKELIVL